MKRHLLALSVLLFGLFAFLGCGETTTTTTTTGSVVTSETTTTPGVTTVTTTTTSGTVVTELSYTVTNVPFTNYSTEFVSDSIGENIDFYYFSDKPGIPYVDIEEFITLLTGLLDPTIDVAYDDADTVRVFIYYEYTPEEMAENGLDDPIFTTNATFHFDTQTVSAPNVDSFDYFSGETSTDFSEGLNLVSYSEGEEPPFLADVAAYGFSFHHLDLDTDKYVIPLSMADLFLTGSMYDVSPNWDDAIAGYHLYGFDTYQYYDIADSLGDTNPDNDGLYDIIAKHVDTTAVIKTETVNFIAFSFNYFYGLKEYHGVTDFLDYTWNYFPNLYNSTFLGNIYNFVESFEDGHTSVVSPGHHEPGYTQYKVYDDLPPYLISMYDQYYDCGCDLLESDFQLTFSGNAALLRVSTFSADDFKDQISTMMEQIREANVDKVLIDITCNGGGVIANVFTLMNYMTNENIGMYYSTDGADMSYIYDVEGDLAIDADFYILTSGWSYSAANLFAAMSTEMGIAQTVGTQSGGGACSIKAVILPNGTLLVMSSKTNLTYSTFETVEEGVAPDIYINWASYASFPSFDQILVAISQAQG